jgi:RimJ/RimL family protein N-acetyltransferase
MHLSCGPCVVRSWRHDDLESLIRHADNPRIAAQLRDAFPQPYDRAAGVAWLTLAATMQPEVTFAIDVEGAAVGGIGLKLGTDVERVSAEVGYWLGEDFWGRGITTAALIGLSRWAFANLELTRLFALPFAHNTASRRVLEKAGFALEAILRKSAIKHGQVVDQALYALVRE